MSLLKLQGALPRGRLCVRGESVLRIFICYLYLDDVP